MMSANEPQTNKKVCNSTQSFVRCRSMPAKRPTQLELSHETGQQDDVNSLIVGYTGKKLSLINLKQLDFSDEKKCPLQEQIEIKSLSVYSKHNFSHSSKTVASS